MSEDYSQNDYHLLNSSEEILYSGNDPEDNTPNFFIVEFNLKKYEKYEFICSTCNKIYTAILYNDNEHKNLILFIYKNIFDTEHEHITYKLISSLSFNKKKFENSDTTISENPQKINKKKIYFEDESEVYKKTVTNTYNLFLINKNFIIIQCLNIKIVLVDFLLKKFSTLFSNIDKNRSNIKIIHIHDELIKIKKYKKGVNYIVKSLVFCLINNQLYYFIIHDSNFYQINFSMKRVTFDDTIKTVDSFVVDKITDESDKKNFYYLFCIISEKKFIRFITDYMKVSLQEILNHFRQYFKSGFIFKMVNSFDKTQNATVKIFKSYVNVNFILLQIGMDVLSFKFYHNDTPNDLKKRFGFELENLKEKINNNHLNNEENEDKESNESVKEENSLKIERDDSDVFSSKKLNNLSKIFSNLNINKINSNKKLIKSNSIKSNKKLLRINTISSNKNLLNIYSISPPKKKEKKNNDNMNNNSKISSFHNKININSFRNSSNGSINSNENKKSENSHNNSIFQTKEQEIIQYSLTDNINNMTKSINYFSGINHSIYFNAESKIIYSYSYTHLIKFTQFTSIISFFTFPHLRKSIVDFLQSKVFFEKKFEPNDIVIYDILHYPQFNFSFLLTNKYIIKLRFNNTLYNIIKKSTRISYSPSTTNEDIFTKLKILLKYEKYERIKEKFDTEKVRCRVCQKLNVNITCKKCKRVFYCSQEHLDFDYVSFHFFECKMIKFIKSLNSKEEDYKLKTFKIINGLIKVFQMIIHKLFHLIRNKKDYIQSLYFLKLMLNILPMVKIENFLSERMNKLKSIVIMNSKTVCDKIFNLELWWFYSNLNTLYINFALRANLTLLAYNTFIYNKMMDLISKKDNKVNTLFDYFGLGNDLFKYDISSSKDEIIKISKDYFFNLMQIYTNNYSDEKNLNIQERFIIYQLHSFTSLAKIGMKISELNGYSKVNEHLLPILGLIPNLLEDIYYGGEYLNEKIDYKPQIALSLIYYFLSINLVKLNKIYISIILMRYILAILKKYSEKYNNKDEKYYSFQAKVLINNGILLYYIGNYSLGIHKLEEGYRIIYEKKLDFLLYIKVKKLLVYAYININKIQTAYTLLKELIYLQKGLTSLKINQNNLISFLFYYNYCKSKLILLFLFHYLAYKYNRIKYDNKNLKKSKNNNNNKQNQILYNNFNNIYEDKVPDNILPSHFDFINLPLIDYIGENELKYRKIQSLNEHSNDLSSSEIYYENYNDIISNTYNFPYFNKNNPPAILNALEFLYNLTNEEYAQINEDNPSIIIEDNLKDDLRDRSSVSISKDNSISIAIKEKNPVFKEEEINYMDEIEIKMSLYDMFNSSQQQKLLTISNNILLRSILLRDQKGKIDKFNLNYHPKYTYDFMNLIKKFEENYFIKQLENIFSFNIYENQLFDIKNGYLLTSLRKFLNLEKIQNILFLKKIYFVKKINNINSYINYSSFDSNNSINQDWYEKLQNKFNEMNDIEFVNEYSQYIRPLVDKLNKNELNFIYNNPKNILHYIYSDEKIKSPIKNKEKDKGIETQNETNNSKIINIDNSNNYYYLNNNNRISLIRGSSSNFEYTNTNSQKSVKFNIAKNSNKSHINEKSKNENININHFDNNNNEQIENFNFNDENNKKQTNLIKLTEIDNKKIIENKYTKKGLQNIEEEVGGDSIVSKNISKLKTLNNNNNSEEDYENMNNIIVLKELKIEDSKNSNSSSSNSKQSSSKQQSKDDNKIIKNINNTNDVNSTIKAKTNKTIKEEEEDSLFTISDNEDKIDNKDIKNISFKFSNFSKISIKEENNSSSSFKDENKLIEEINKEKKISIESPNKKKPKKNSIPYNTQQIPKSKNFVYHNNNNNINNNKNIQSNNNSDKNSILFNNKNAELNSRNKKDSLFNNGLTTLHKTNDNNNNSNIKKTNKTTINNNNKKKEIEPNEIIDALLENKYLNKLDKYFTNDNNFNASVKTDITNKGFSETSSNSNNSNNKYYYKSNIINYETTKNIEKTQIKTNKRKPPSYQTLKEKVLKRKPQNNYY